MGKEKEELKRVFAEQINQLEEKVIALQKAVAELKTSGLNEKVILFAIQKASNKYYKGYPKIGIAEVKAIYRGLENVEKFLFPEKE